MSYFHNVGLLDRQIQRVQRVHPLGAAIVDVPTRLVGASFHGSNDSLFWTLANSGAGSAAAVANFIATLTSGTANNGYGQIGTVRQARFLFANPNIWRAAVRLTTVAVSKCTRRGGAFTPAANPYDTPTNGFGFEVAGDGTISCITWSNGAVVKSASSGAFNGEVSSFALDTDVHALEIIYFVMGAWYFIDGVLLQHHAPTTALLAQNISLPSSFTVYNEPTGVTSGTMEVYASSILRYGKELTRPQSVFITSNTTTVCKIGPGTIHAIIVGKGGSGGHTITIYDNTAASGTILWVGTSPVQGSYPFGPNGLDFYTGLTVVTASGTAGDFTIVYD